MVLTLERTVEFSMVDLANIAYYPRIYDLAHRFFEATWPEICGQTYPHVLYERKVGFPLLHIESSFHKPMRYGDTITANITITHLGNTSLTWRYRLSPVAPWSVEHAEGPPVFRPGNTQTQSCREMKNKKK